MRPTKDYKRKLYTVFFAERRIILTTTLIISILTVFIALFWPVTYSSVGKILITGKQFEKTPEAIEVITEHTRKYPVTKESLFTEIEIMESNEVMELTIMELKEKGLMKDKEEKGLFSLLSETIRRKISQPLKVFDSYDMEEERDSKKVTADEINMLRGKKKTMVVPDSNVIEISYFDRNKNLTAPILNTFMKQYVIYRRLIEESTEARQFFSEQVSNFKKAIMEKEDELLDLLDRTAMSDPTAEINSNMLIKRDLEIALNDLKDKAINIKAQAVFLETTLDKKDITFFTFIEGIRSISDFSQNLQKVALEYQRVLTTFHPESHKAKTKKRQMENAFLLLKAEVNSFKEQQKNQLRMINERIERIEDRIENFNDRNQELEKNSIYSERLKREIQMLQSSYETFFKRREGSRLKAALGESDFNIYVNILSKAKTLDKPVFPQKSRVIPVGILVGFITGCCFGFMREYFDHSFKTPNDIKNYVGLPIIFSIPKFNRLTFTKNVVLIAISILIVWSYMHGYFFLTKSSEVGQNEYNESDDAISLEESPLYYSYSNIEEMPGEAVDTSELVTKMHSEIKDAAVIYSSKRGHWFLLVNSYNNDEIAYIEVERLWEDGLNAVVRYFNVKGYGLKHHVLVGPFMQKEEAYRIKHGGVVPVSFNKM